ncbi:hypothetical protein GCM10009627_32580 [Curtobacterium herbarum]|uniref:Uncharacterized protein n=1 Tax=Curtobacterium herbarum TaxID=150122 RepID=A0ABP4KBZ6_9MICO|nr:hypothetical protein [Curtobacterium herbarum]
MPSPHFAVAPLGALDETSGRQTVAPALLTYVPFVQVAAGAGAGAGGATYVPTVVTSRRPWRNAPASRPRRSGQGRYRRAGVLAVMPTESNRSARAVADPGSTP